MGGLVQDRDRMKKHGRSRVVLLNRPFQGNSVLRAEGCDLLSVLCTRIPKPRMKE